MCYPSPRVEYVVVVVVHVGDIFSTSKLYCLPPHRVRASPVLDRSTNPPMNHDRLVGSKSRRHEQQSRSTSASSGSASIFPRPPECWITRQKAQSERRRHSWPKLTRSRRRTAAIFTSGTPYRCVFLCFVFFFLQISNLHQELIIIFFLISF